MYKIKASNVSGEGVFAAKKIPARSNLGLGFVRTSYTQNPDKDYIRTKLGEKINHSPSPNASLFAKGNKFYIIATKEIELGEEIFLDYHPIPWEGKTNF